MPTRDVEKIEFQRFADMPYMEAMSVSGTRRHFSAFHETYTICMNVTHGGAEWLYRGKRERGTGSMLMLMEPGETHRTVKLLANPGSFRVLHLNPDWLNNTAQQADVPAGLHFSVGMLTDPRIYDALQSFYRCSNDEVSLLERESRLANFLDVIFKYGIENKLRSNDRHVPRKALYRAREYLVANYDQKVALDDLTAVTGLTKSHFVRSFTRVYGLSPHAYLTHIRISQARKRLIAGEPLIGSEIGFFDQSHFIRAFRKALGTTPARYATAQQSCRTKRPRAPSVN